MRGGEGSGIFDLCNLYALIGDGSICLLMYVSLKI